MSVLGAVVGFGSSGWAADVSVAIDGTGTAVVLASLFEALMLFIVVGDVGWVDWQWVQLLV